MSAHIDDGTLREHSRRKQDALEYRAIFALVFVFYLVSVSVHRLIPGRWRPNLDPAGRSRSLIGEAYAAASNSLPFAFM